MVGAEVVGLTKSPLSRAFRVQLEESMGCPVQVVNVAELQRGGIAGFVLGMRRIRAKLLMVIVEDSSVGWVEQALQLLAGVASVPKREVVRGDLSREAFSRWTLIPIAGSLICGSIVNAWSTLVCLVQLLRLRALKPMAVVPATWPSSLYINANLWFGLKAGGSVGHISGVINSLVKRGLRVVFASCGGRLMVSSGVEYVSLHTPVHFGIPIELNNYRFHRTATRQLESKSEIPGRVGFIYQRLSTANFTGALLSRRWQVPLVTEYNGSEAWVAKHWGRPLKFHQLAVLAEDVMLRHSHLIVTVSEVLRDELVARGISPERIVTYPNCIDPAMFDPTRLTSGEIRVHRERLGIRPESLVIGFLGTFGQWHGVDVLGRAIRRLADYEADWLRCHRVHFLLVGDGVKMPELRAAIESPTCQEFTTLVGLVPQQDGPFYLATSDILVSPHVRNADGSRFFGSPTKLFEYMAMGKGIVASNLDQIGDVLRESIQVGALPRLGPDADESRLAVLCEPGNVDELVKGMKFLVENDSWRSVLGSNARAEALAKYTWDRHVAEVMTGLERVCAR